MPKPHSGESEQAFISRCMAYPDLQSYEPDQRAAICYRIWRGDEAIHPDFHRIIRLFFRRYPAADAAQKFSRFVTRNHLNLAKAYSPDVQFRESFEWIEPLIRPYKADTDAKYYLVTALTADISMNNVDYGPDDRLAREDSSMNWRPVNVNHDHHRWLPYPRTRVDFSASNEFSLEATLRVDNQDAWLQQKLDRGDIVHPSIEGRPHPISGRYHFTGLALLERGVELPGSPLSEIVPLVFNERVGNSVCEFKGGQMVCECDPLHSEVNQQLKQTVKESVKQAIKDVIREQARTDADRAKAHFHISDDAWDKLSDAERQAYIDKLPPRGTAGQESEQPVLKTPDETGPDAETQPPTPHECPTGFHWDGSQCVPDESGDSAESPMVKLPGPHVAVYESDVPPATNAPSTVAKDDTATCPEGQHWDDDAGKCVPDVMEDCEAGWHFDVALQKCVPDNPQVNEYIDKRLADNTLRLENDHLRETNTALRHANNRLQLKSDTQSKTIYKLEGEHVQLRRENDRKDTQIKELVKDTIALEKSNRDWQHKANDYLDNLGTAKNQNSDITEKYTKMYAENQKVIAENVQLKTDLTEAKTKELQWNKDRKDLQEGLAKALKHQKYVYEFLKSKGFELVATDT